MTDEKIKENAELFDMMLRATMRPGVDELLEWLHSTDFYTAPASTRHHLAEPGGLLAHSMHVFECFMQIVDGMELYKSGKEEDIRWFESAVICCLLHDVCKVGLYTPVEGGYKYNKEIAEEGHGSRSVVMLRERMQYFDLKDEEAEAIGCHMSLWDSDDRRAMGDVYRRNTLAWLVHAADEAATFIIEK